MKKILFLLIIAPLVFFGCSGKTKYQIINDFSGLIPEIEYLDGTLYDVIIFEYFDSNIVKQVNVEKIPIKGKTEKFTAHKKAEKIRITFKWLPECSPYYNMVDRQITYQYFYLDKGRFIKAELNENTIIK